MDKEHKSGKADVDEQATESKRSQFLSVLLQKRKQAIEARRNSGIETEWKEDEEFYQGIDDANRAYHARSTMSAAKRWAEGYGGRDKVPERSVVFINITKPYVNAASARVADMLLPTDDRSWELKPTPIPRLQPWQVQMLGGEQGLQALVDKAKADAERMQERIDDCLVESGWHSEVRRLIEDAARIGSGVLKGPVPVLREARVTTKDPVTGTSAFMKVSEIKPGSKRISCWNLFPDPSCGNDIHAGSFVFEREYLSRRQVKEMLKMPGYDRRELLLALQEGPKRVASMDSNDELGRSDVEFEHWIFHGHTDSQSLEANGVDVGALSDDVDADRIPAMAELINDRIVKVTVAALDSGDFPYDILPWSERPDMPWGVSVARDIRTAQRMLNGGARGMMDNGGLTAAPQIVIGNGVTPEDGRYTLRGGKIWRAEPDATTADVREAFNAFHVPSVQGEMMGIINFALKIAEDTTGLPQMLQGIKGDAPDTLGGMEMQNNNATSILRRMAKRFDDYLTRPHIQRYYDWMMQHGDDDSVKGDFQIEVRGSSALVERASQQQFLLQLASFSRDPVYGIDPPRLVEELAKGQKLDPRRFMLPQEQRQSMQPQQQPDPLAQARAGTEQARAQLLIAQAENVKVDTVDKRVKSSFASVQTARELAVTPGIAGSADQVYRSAGGEDMNAAPIFSEPPADAATVPPVNNTDPLTPAGPLSPGVGVNQGIEGGQDEAA